MTSQSQTDEQHTTEGAPGAPEGTGTEGAEGTTSAPGTAEGTPGALDPQQPSEDGTEGAEEQQPSEDADTFPRSYVEQLRTESHGYRQQLRDQQQRADDLAAQLWHANVAATGRLADPTDLQQPEGVDPSDTEAIGAAVDELLQRKPHLQARVAHGDIGQHSAPGGSEDESFSFLGAMQQRA